MPIYLDKPLGKTPYDLIKELQYIKPSKYSFAGRLDPMARGKMIILENEERKTQDQFCKYEKVYQFQILFGYSTDTYDILGLVQKKSLVNHIPALDLDKYLGTFKQPYPPYSSIIVNKKPLWLWSREGKIGDITIPEKEVTIWDLKFLGDIKIESNSELLEKLEEKIFKLDTYRHKEFRVPQILKKWRDTIKNTNGKPIIKQYEVRVSSGTYVRSLVNKIGEDLGCGALAWDINRTEFLLPK